VSERALRLAVAGLSLVGAGIAAYLVFVRYTGGTLACTTGGCETVQSSEYAKVLGVPVAVIGLAGYLLILASALVPGEVGAAAGAALALAGISFSVYLVYVQVALIDAICQWCIASDAVMVPLFAATALRLRAAVRVA